MFYPLAMYYEFSGLLNPSTHKHIFALHLHLIHPTFEHEKISFICSLCVLVRYFLSGHVLSMGQWNLGTS